MDIMEEVGKNWAEEVQHICVVEPDKLQYVWQVVSDIMKEKPKGILDRHELEDIYNTVKAGQWQLWIGVDQGDIELVGLTQFESYKTGMVMRVIYVGGQLSKFMPLGMQQMEEFACLAGAKSVTCDTSAAVVRMFQKYGYHIKSYEMSKSVQTLWR